MSIDRRLSALEDEFGVPVRVRMEADRLNKLSPREVTAALNRLNDDEARAIIAAMDLRAAVNWASSTLGEDRPRALKLISDEQLEELYRITKERAGAEDAFDLGQLTDAQLDKFEEYLIEGQSGERAYALASQR